MQAWTRFFAGVMLFACAFFLNLSAACAQDVLQVAPKQCKVLLENERVRVVEITLKPGEKLVLHSHPASVTHVLAPGKLKTTLPDGTVVELEAALGQTLWSESGGHEQINVGTTEVRALVIEMKASAATLEKK